MRKIHNYIDFKNLYSFYLESNKKNKDKVLYVLCGYKKFLYAKVFNRIESYISKKLDVCLITSGLYSSEIYEIAKKNKWSYLSTKINNIDFAQNVVIEIYNQSNVFIKMDEDIFVTKNSFENLIKTYENAKNNNEKIAYVAPLLNVNGYGTRRCLELLNYLDSFENKYGKIKYDYGQLFTKIEKNINFVKSMWNLDNSFLPLDVANNKLNEINCKYTYCDINFSIGLILFEKDFWLKIGKFKTHLNKRDFGLDEKQLNKIAKKEKYKKIIANNTLVGHFSFKGTTKKMKEEFEKKPDLF